MLPSYLARHQVGSRHHDAAEVELFCQSLKHRLDTWLTEISEESPETRLSQLLSAAEQLDHLAKDVDRHHGDSRLEHVLKRLAECLRLTSPALLRWSHGVHSGNAHVSLAQREKLGRHDLTSLLGSLPAA